MTMLREPSLWHVYMGVTILRKTTLGPALKWTARIEGHGYVSADTLAGIKQLIKHTLKGQDNG